LRQSVRRAGQAPAEGAGADRLPGDSRHRHLARRDRPHRGAGRQETGDRHHLGTPPEQGSLDPGLFLRRAGPRRAGFGGGPLMETKANYVAVGAFVLACVIGLVVTVMWLAGVQYSQEYAYYQSYFKGPVTGLAKGTSTRYNGIEVGRITDLAFDPADPQRVIVTMQVQPNLNIREDSVASIESQGFTGATFVEITGGTAKSPLLEAHDNQRYPVIHTKPSTFAQLQQSAPEVSPSSMSRPRAST